MKRGGSRAPSRQPFWDFKPPPHIQSHLDEASSLASRLSGGDPSVSDDLKSAIGAVFAAIPVRPPRLLLDYVTWRLESISSDLDAAAAQPGAASVSSATDAVLFMVASAVDFGRRFPEFCSLAFRELEKLTDALCRNSSPDVVRDAQKSTFSAALSSVGAFCQRPDVAIGNLFAPRMSSLSTATSEDLISDLRVFWDFAHEQKIAGLAEEIGDLIVGVLETRTDDELSMSDAAGLYLEAVRRADDQSADGLREVLLGLLERRIGWLEDFRRRLLSSSSSDRREDSKLLNSRTVDVIQAIGRAREAEFIRHGDDPFQCLSVEESENVRRFLGALLRTASNDEALLRTTSNDEALLRTQSNDEALSLAYEQSLSSSTGLIVAAIRNDDLTAALDMFASLRMTLVEYSRHLSSVSRRALDAIDVSGARDADLRLRVWDQSAIESSIVDSLRGLLGSIVDAFERNVSEIDARHATFQQESKSELEQRFMTMESELNFPALVVLEKQYAIARRREMKKVPPPVAAKRTEVRRLAADRDFTRAEKEKRRLKGEIDSDIRARLAAVDQRFARQRAALLREQQREMNVIETALRERLMNRGRRKQQEVLRLRTAFAAAVRAQHQRMLTFAQKLQSKKDWKGRLEEIVKAVLTERGYSDFIPPKR
jgi:hypothetical protein